MHKILKRLELIKTAISIEDEEIIELQVMKLNSIDCDNKVKNIIIMLDDKDYGNVIVEIESYLQKYSGVVVYEDKELQGLRLELKALEKKLQNLSSEKNEYLNDIHEFNVQYHLHLGAIIQEILNLKEELLYASVKEKQTAFDDLKSEYENVKAERDYFKSQREDKEKELEEMDEFDDELYDELQELNDILADKEKELNDKRKETKQAKEEFEDDEVNQEYEEVKQDSEEFSKEHEEVENEDRLDISDEEKKELKKFFRKASKLCHPDIVSAELKEQAHEIMQQLNDANAKRDINTIREILISLESGNGFDVASDTIEDKDLLRAKIVDIRDMIHQNESEIEEIKEDEVIQIIEGYDDVDDYFKRLEEELQNEYDRLKDADKRIETQRKEKVPMPEDDFWKEEF